MAQPSPPFVWSVGSSPESFFQRTPVDTGYPTFLHQQQLFPHPSPSTANSVTRSPYYDASPMAPAHHPPHSKPPYPYGNRMAFDLGSEAFVSYPVRRVQGMIIFFLRLTRLSPACTSVSRHLDIYTPRPTTPTHRLCWKSAKRGSGGRTP